MEEAIVVVLAMIFLLVLSIVLAIPVYFLWNWLIPDIFGLPAITLFQSWGLCVLSEFLIKSRTTSSKKS